MKAKTHSYGPSFIYRHTLYFYNNHSHIMFLIYFNSGFVMNIKLFVS